MRVSMQEQTEGAKVEVDPDTGELVLLLRRGLVSGGAFAALVVALGALPDQCYEYLQRAM